MATHTDSLTISKKNYKKPRKTSTRIKDLVTKVISFYGKSWEYICKAIDALKNRYKKRVRLLNQTPIGAGLFSGNIEVA